jgi:hypothetical protein
MLSVGKLFAVAAIIALIVGFISWPQPETGFYTITLKNRAYGFGVEYWAFSLGAIFAVLAAAYYRFPIVFTHALNSRMSNLHFWLSAFSAVGFLILAPGITFIARHGRARIRRLRCHHNASRCVPLIAVFFGWASNFCH